MTKTNRSHYLSPDKDRNLCNRPPAEISVILRYGACIAWQKNPNHRLCSGLPCLSRENYLQFKGHAPPPRLASVLAFILEVLQRTQSTELCDIDLVLPAVLKCLVLVNELQGEL